MKPFHRPQFSVVIPTYNRSHLLPYAVKSVLDQTFSDFELVISNGGSTDRTREVINSFDDGRIRYIESKRKLTAGDNYQQGLDACVGKFITFLSDDDAYAPNLLEFVNGLQRDFKAQIIGYPYCRYYHDTVREFDIDIPKNSLLIPSFNGRITEFTPENALEQVFRTSEMKNAPVDPRFIPPYLSNAVYESSIFEKIKKVTRSFFKTVPPDEYLAAAVFMVGANYHCVDMPLLVWSSWAGNMTLNASRDTSGIRQHYERLLDGRQLRYTPLKFALPANCGINARLEAAEDFNLGMTIDRKRYFVFIYEYLKSMEYAGVDTSRELIEFENVLGKQEIEIQCSVRARTLVNFQKPKELLKRFMPSVVSVYRKMKSRETGRPTILSGEAYGFSNVYEAAKQVTREITSGAT